MPTPRRDPGRHRGSGREGEGSEAFFLVRPSPRGGGGGSNPPAVNQSYPSFTKDQFSKTFRNSHPNFPEFSFPLSKFRTKPSHLTQDERSRPEPSVGSQAGENVAPRSRGGVRRWQGILNQIQQRTFDRHILPTVPHGTLICFTLTSFLPLLSLALLSLLSPPPIRRGGSESKWSCCHGVFESDLRVMRVNQEPNPFLWIKVHLRLTFDLSTRPSASSSFKNR